MHLPVKPKTLQQAVKNELRTSGGVDGEAKATFFCSICDKRFVEIDIIIIGSIL